MNNAKTFVVFDWAGNRIWPALTWDSFEGAWGFIYLTIPDEEAWQEYYVEEKR